VASNRPPCGPSKKPWLATLVLACAVMAEAS
jgi:hypothetical protein